MQAHPLIIWEIHSKNLFFPSLPIIFQLLITLLLFFSFFFYNKNSFTFSHCMKIKSNMRLLKQSNQVEQKLMNIIPLFMAIRWKTRVVWQIIPESKIWKFENSLLHRFTRCNIKYPWIPQMLGQRERDFTSSLGFNNIYFVG